MNPRIFGLMIIRAKVGHRRARRRGFSKAQRERSRASRQPSVTETAHSLLSSALENKVKRLEYVLRIRSAMTRSHLILSMALCCAASAALPEAGENTALGAIKLLPKGAAARIALLEAREAKPAPDRWHILIHDPKEENGVHEYVVAGGEVVASRSLSQFAESLSAEDVFGDAIKIDSDRVAKLAQQYAEANNLVLFEMNFELKKGGAGAAPLWNVTCFDPEGKEIGHLVLTATKGTVLSHEGFAMEPPPPDKTEKLDKPKETAESSPSGAEPEKRPREPRRTETKRAEPIPPDADNQKPGLFRRAGSTLQHLFSGRDSNRPAPAAPAPPPQ